MGYALVNAGRFAAAGTFLKAALAGEPGAWNNFGDVRDLWLHDTAGAERPTVAPRTPGMWKVWCSSPSWTGWMAT